MGWTSFEGREASSKIEFEERLREMAEKRWARRVFSYLYMRNVDTKWRKLTRKLSIKYLDCRRGANQETAVKKKVKETERGLWKTDADEISTGNIQNFQARNCQRKYLR